ncbi:MAG: hypothetical protein K2M95_06380 [Clostridiales bacterium]|nr:hypothetical protein [Clostridiales bacterium]
MTTEKKGTVLYEDDGADAIAKLVPPLCSAGIVANSEDAAKVYARTLRHRGVRSVLLHGAPSEDVRLLVALGGDTETERAKRLGAQYGLDVFGVFSVGVRTALDGFYTQGLHTYPCAYPVGAAICDELVLPSLLPHSLASICAAALAVCDGETAARLRGMPVGSMPERALDIVYAALDAAKQGRGCPTLAHTLIKLSFSLAKLGQGEQALPTRCAAELAARAATLLFRREKRTPLPLPVFGFLFGEKLAALYRVFLQEPPLFCPPPDDNLRAAYLTEYFGLSPLTAASAASTHVPFDALAAFRLREYQTELLSRAEECVRVFSEARRPFCRLFPDDGFSLVNALDGSDIKTVVALAPDLFSLSLTLLGVMRAAGVLDRYLE